VPELSGIMLALQKQKCHNINLVTPSHFVPEIIKSVRLARNEGLQIPIVYNTSGYETVKTLRLLEGIVDIYLPDAKYADNVIAEKYSKAENYPLVNKKALKEMYRQVGNLEVNRDGIAVSGLIIRHLVLPGNLSGTDRVLPWIAKNISKETYISLMAQYFPAYEASEYPMLSRRINKKEYDKAIEIFNSSGLINGWIQEFD